jgi:excisionase family DNA binding protein
MPRTKKKSGAASQPPMPPTVNGGQSVEDVMTLADAAAYLKLSEADVLRLVNEQALPARHLGNEWRFLKAAIQQWLSTPTLKTNNEAWMALAGSCKDDPDLEGIVEDAYRRRGRPITEDGSYKNFSR